MIQHFRNQIIRNRNISGMLSDLLLLKDSDLIFIQRLTSAFPKGIPLSVISEPSTFENRLGQQLLLDTNVSAIRFKSLADLIDRRFGRKGTQSGSIICPYESVEGTHMVHTKYLKIRIGFLFYHTIRMANRGEY